MFPYPREWTYIAQPEGLQDDALKPPEPEGMPLARMLLADINLHTCVLPHWGHFGGGSLEDSINSSKQ